MSLADIELTNLDTEPIFNDQIRHIDRSIHDHFPTVKSHLYLLDESGSYKRQQLSSDIGHEIQVLSKDASTITLLKSQKDYAGFKIRTSQIRDLLTEDEAGADWAIVSPVRFEESLVGMLLLLLPDGLELGDQEISSIDRYAQAIGLAFITARLLEKYQERCDQLTVMLEVNTHLNIAATKSDYLEEISRFGKYFIHFDRAVLVLHSEETPEYFTIDHIEGDSQGLQVGMSYPVFDTLVSKCIRSGKSFLYRQNEGVSEKGIYWEGDAEESPFAQVIGFPLGRMKEAPGALILESLNEAEISESEISIFEMISESLGVALTRFSLVERLANYATIDTLTHLYNIRALKQRFAEELARAGRYQNSLTVLFLDLDGFKSVNDSYGHLVGDYVLRETAHIIRERIRTSDIPGRYGGEEFVVIMVNSDAESCLASAERICNAIREHHFEMNDITIENRISIGLAEFPADGETMEALIQSADTAMYTAKRQGGDQVIKYQEGMAQKSDN
ncbi:MAG: GGDEF domain-containing protein [Candidatus Marinimicrobia bacterium]|nr:GGDEF domain-containing protein [Candidatus Neomarinimicrobiota bacterium]MCF7904435.1 GGDEF domain-containing protein [Candidatus Neomarinimicrobiota bacterium]